MCASLVVLGECEVHSAFRGLYENADQTMLTAADAAIRHCETLPAENFVIPERTPTALRGKGRRARQEGVKQFPGDGHTADQTHAMSTGPA